MSRWPVVAFGEVLTPNRRPHTLAFDEDANLVGMRLYGLGPFHRELKPADMIRKKTHFVIREGDVIYNKLFAWKGTFGVVPPDLDGMFVSDKFPTYALDKSRLSPDYLRWYFRLPSLWEQARQMSTGSAALSKLTLNPPRFLDLTMPLPPIDEQRRVVEKLDRLAAVCSQANHLFSSVSLETEALIGSMSRRVFGAEIQPDWLPLGELVQDIENGWSPACHSRPALAEEWGVIRLGAVSFGTFDANENKALPGHLVPRPKYEIRSGDLLISRANTQELVGASALVKEVRPRLMLCDKVFRVVFRPASAIDAVYLDRTLKSPAIRRQVEAAATGTSPTMKNISKAKLMALRLPVPPIDVQQRLVTRLRAFEERIGKTRELSNRTHLELGALQAATVDRALTA